MKINKLMKINEPLQLVLEFIPTPIQNLKVIFG